MASNILTKIFGSRNDRLLKTYRKTVERINALETQYDKLTTTCSAPKPRSSKTVWLRA